MPVWMREPVSDPHKLRFRGGEADGRVLAFSVGTCHLTPCVVSGSLEQKNEEMSWSAGRPAARGDGSTMQEESERDLLPAFSSTVTGPWIIPKFFSWEWEGSTLRGAGWQWAWQLAWLYTPAVAVMLTSLRHTWSSARDSREGQPREEGAFRDSCGAEL